MFVRPTEPLVSDTQTSKTTLSLTKFERANLDHIIKSMVDNKVFRLRLGDIELELSQYAFLPVQAQRKDGDEDAATIPVPTFEPWVTQPLAVAADGAAAEEAEPFWTERQNLETAPINDEELFLTRLAPAEGE